jgi:phosphohistidine phosphatase
MKRLTLIRHAKASANSPTGQDFHRPLSRRGYLDAPRMGKYLKAKCQFIPAVIISSDATRALSTAQLIAAELNIKASADIHETSTIYEAPLSNLLAIAKTSDRDWKHVCMVGHNPGMEMFANYLLGKNAISGFVTCGVATIDLKIDKWYEIEENCGKLVSYFYPEILWGDEHR